MVDLSSPAEPEFAGCFAEDGYTHQGWLTADHEWFVFGDELDEDGPLTRSDEPVPNTATYMMKVGDLKSPGAVKTFLRETTAIDHNLYIEDGYIWQANYMAGLRVMDHTEDGLANGELTQVAFFDVDPGPDEFAFAGAWTAYPFFESGTIALNSSDSGLFLLRADLPEKAEVQPAPAEEEESQPAPSGEDDQTESAADPSNLPATGGGAAAAVLGLAPLAGAVGLRRGR